MHRKSFIISFVLTFCMTIGLLSSIEGKVINAQEVTPNPTPTPLAHLTFRTCLIEETTNFRLFFRADYHAGEYRVVGQNSGFTLNTGYLNLNQVGGGLGPDNTTFILPYEDTWLKQWYNTETQRWQRSGSIPETNVEEHLANGWICEQSGSNTYYTPSPSPTPTDSIVILLSTPTPIPTTAPTTNPTSVPTPTDSPAIGGVSEIQLALNTNTQQVLGITTMAETGSATDNLMFGQFVIGLLSVFEGSRRLLINKKI